MHIWVIGFLLLSVAGCVSQVRYDRVVEQLNAIRKELNVAKAEELALIREVETLKSINQKAKSDVLAASDDLQRAGVEAEAERHRAEGQFVTPERAVGQLNAQLLTLRDKLADAKNDTIALKELVALYQRKMRAEVEAGEPAPPPAVISEPEPAGVSLMAPPETETPPSAASVQVPQKKEAAAPPEEGLLSTILNWLLSLWHWIVGFVRGLFRSGTVTSAARDYCPPLPLHRLTRLENIPAGVMTH
jgi:cell division protein FtsB